MADGENNCGCNDNARTDALKALDASVAVVPYGQVAATVPARAANADLLNNLTPEALSLTSAEIDSLLAESGFSTSGLTSESRQPFDSRLGSLNARPAARPVAPEQRRPARGQPATRQQILQNTTERRPDQYQPPPTRAHPVPSPMASTLTPRSAEHLQLVYHPKTGLNPKLVTRSRLVSPWSELESLWHVGQTAAVARGERAVTGKLFATGGAVMQGSPRGSDQPPVILLNKMEEVYRLAEDDTDESEEGRPAEPPRVVDPEGNPFPSGQVRRKTGPSDDELVRIVGEEPVEESRELQSQRRMKFEHCNEKWFLHYQSELWYRTRCTELAFKMEKEWGVSKAERDFVIPPMRPWEYFPNWFEGWANAVTESEGQRAVSQMAEPATGTGKIIHDCIQEIFRSGLRAEQLVQGMAHTQVPELGDPYLAIARLANECDCPNVCPHRIVDILYSHVGLVTNAPRIGYPDHNVQPQVAPKFRWELEQGYDPDDPDGYYLVVYVDIEWGLNWDILFSIECVK